MLISRSPALLLIAYGSCNTGGLAALRRFEARVRANWPGMPVRWAYTSLHIRARLATQARLKSDSVVKALRRLALERYGPIAAQPLQIVPATENESVEELARLVAEETGVHVQVGAPLLACRRDLEESCEAMLGRIPAERLPDEDVVLMGHGAQHAAQARYDILSDMLAARDGRVHLATMSGGVTIEHILPRLRSHRVWLMPFLSVVGKHTVSDMAGPQPGSWKSCIEAAGHECAPVIAGAIEYDGFADIWMRHLAAAIADLGIAPPRPVGGQE